MFILGMNAEIACNLGDRAIASCAGALSADLSRTKKGYSFFATGKVFF